MSGVLSHLFWLTALVPGFAVLLRLDRRNARFGLLAGAALSFALTLALAAPLTTIAFAAGWSIETAATAWALLVAAGLAASLRGAGGWLRAAWRATPRLEFALLLAGLALVAPFGGVVGGDSPIHVAKVRWIMEVGCTLQDPYSPAAVIESRYHADAWHLLLAIGAWLGRRDPLDWWYESAWFARLLAVGAIELLAVVLLRSRRAGAIAAVGGFLVIATTRTITYPNKFTAFVLLPVLVAWTLDWLRQPRRGALVLIAATSLAFAVVHVGFWVVVGLSLLPAAALLRVARARRAAAGARGTTLRSIALFAVAYLAPGLPFALFTALQPNHSPEQQDAVVGFVLRTFHVAGVDFTIVDPRGPGAMGSAGIAILLLLLLRRGRRESDRFAALWWTSAAACMWFPPLFALLARVMPYWIVMRCAYGLYPFSFALVPGVPAWFLLRRLRAARGRLAGRMALLRFAPLVVVACGSTLLHVRGIQRYWWTRDRHLAVEADAAALRELLASAPQERPRIASDPTTSTLLPAAIRCSVIAPLLLHTNPADAGLLRRFQLGEELFAPATAPSRRAELLRELGSDYVLLATRAAAPQGDEGEGGEEPQSVADPGAFAAICEPVAAAGRYVLLRPRS